MTEPSYLHSTRAAYDAMAASYAEQFRDEMAGVPIERAMLSAFADLVHAGGGGTVADIGCGPGTATAYLHGQKLDVFGVDLSPGMLAQARVAYPHLRFEQGTMTALEIGDGALAGVSAIYCVIHIPDDVLPVVFAEFRRVLAPGGHLLLAFMDMDEQIRRTEALGHLVELDYHMRSVARTAEFLTEAGFEVRVSLRRETQEGERLPRGMILARRSD